MIHHFVVKIKCNLINNSVFDNEPISERLYDDHGFIMLPNGYTDNGTPTRLVICCHGAGGTVTTDDAQVERSLLPRYLVANGYAVMDVNGLPELFAKEKGIDLRNNIGSPIAIQSYVKAYHYCIDRFNLYKEVFIHGASMGGITSANLVLSGQIPVIAHSAFCPVLDTYNEIFLHPWSDGLPKIALGKIYNLKTDEFGEYIYDESRVVGYNPIMDIKTKDYPVPIKCWHCEDDDVVSCKITKDFINTIRDKGGKAYLRTFEHGKHEPQLVGKKVDMPSGFDFYNGCEINVTPAVEEAFCYIKSFDF